MQRLDGKLLITVAGAEGIDIIVREARIDGLGRRVRKIVTNSGDLDGTTVYYYNGNQIIQTDDSSGNLTGQMYHGTRYIDELIVMRLPEGRVYVHQDHNYNVINLTDLTGRVLERNYYSPYGEPEITVDAHFFDYDDDGDVDANDLAAATSSGTCWGDYSGDCKRLDADAEQDIGANDYNAIEAYTNAQSSETELQRIPGANHSRLGNPFAHQGLTLDAEIQSYQNRARQYAPKSNRFMQRDPLGYTDGVNAYLYISNSPLLLRDPNGNIPLIPELEAIVNIADSVRYDVGLGIEIGTSLPIGIVYGPAFSHCLAHCLITRAVGEETSKEIGKDTEDRQTATCITLQICGGLLLPPSEACKLGVCRSANQRSDYWDNQLGRDVAGGDEPCFGGCKARMSNKTDHEEGPNTVRPYGPGGCPPGPPGDPNAPMPTGWGPE